MVLLARKDEEGNTQALYDHLHGAGRLASGFEDEFADISRTAAVLHDVGKVAQQFQTYLLSDDGHRGDVQHARQGAFVVNDFFESKGEIEEIAKEILELAISKHHGGLPDCIDESGNRAFLLGFTESDKSNEKYAYQEIKRGLNGLALDLQSNFRGSAEDIACFLKKIKSLRLSKDSIYFYLGLLVKLIYSRLVDADRTDAACFETRKQYRPNAVDWQNLISRLDKNMRSFDSSSEILMEALAPSWRKEQVSAQKMQRKSRKLWSRFSRMMRVRHVRRDRWKCWMSSGLHITARGGQYSSAKVHRSVSVDADGTVNVDDASIPGLRYEVIEGR